jgi:DNA helicase-2/ATP-dependent DNA helicase PcrA
MRSMQHARVLARQEREKVGVDPVGLLGRVVIYLKKDYSIDLIEMTPAQMHGSKAEIDGDKILKYNSALSSAERLEVFAHELGHLVMHGRLLDPSVPVDPIVASAYGDAGPASIARYSSRTREEAEARAFALEFLCPSPILFARWREDESSSILALAGEYGVERAVVRIQLANALHDLAIGVDRPEETKSADISYTQEQVDAARKVGAPLLVDAGPGTGKTATLVRRVQFALEERGADPSQFLLLTFSNEAAQELRERVSRRFGPAVADAMTISTFHGFGMQFLHSFGNHIGLPADFMLIDEDAQAELISELLGRVACPNLDPLTNPSGVADIVVRYINHCKHRQIDPDKLEQEIANWVAVPGSKDDPASGTEVLTLFREYERLKWTNGHVDYADLILLPLRLLESDPAVRAMYREKFPWVLVDEFQDVTRATSALLRAICGPDNQPWVVGDARQSIYQFLGAARENVLEFPSDFQGAEVLPLTENRRSSDAIVDAANELASLMSAGLGAPSTPWSSVAPVQPLGPYPVSIADAISDHAETEGIVDQIQKWQKEGMALGDIAVLARRHIDVRNVVLALTQRGVKAESAGLLTAEGAAGDLSVVLTLASVRDSASLPRLAIALGRNRIPADQIRATVEYLIAAERGTDGDAEDAEKLSARPTPGPRTDGELLAEIERAREQAGADRYSADGFDALTSFLFDSSDYLRRILDAPDDANRSMTLIEVVSTLSLATAYRVTHRGGKRHQLRFGFAARLRERLTHTVPIPIAPRRRPDAVRVMTCHASKGLEFPCVLVASQTLPTFPQPYACIPPSCRPRTNEDIDQANSLLFVGVTRAKRAVVASYPAKATDNPGSREKKLVPLLDAWMRVPGVHRERWTAPGGPVVHAVAGAVWGESVVDTLKPAGLDAGTCPIKTYLESMLELRFPESQLSLYPVFFGALRKGLRALAKQALESGKSATVADADRVLAEQLPESKWEEHPHFELYRTEARRTLRAFVAEFRPGAGLRPLDPEFEVAPSGSGIIVKLDLIARFVDQNGIEMVIGFRPESLSGKLNKRGAVNWSGIKDHAQIPFVLVWQANADAQARVFSGTDGKLYPLDWHARKGMPKAVQHVVARHRALVTHDFSTDIDPHECDNRCRLRVTCPYWTGALP